MCSPAVLGYVRSVVKAPDIRGKRVVEVGSLDVNGSVRPGLEALGPAEYVGVDLVPGPGVDVLCEATGLVGHFGPSAFDVLVSTELLEHVRDWRLAVHNFKQVLRPGGLLLITTRSVGVDFHRHPFDYWRYELADFETIFGDFAIEDLRADLEAPGVFLRARKPEAFRERDLGAHRLYSILRQKRRRDVSGTDLVLFQIRYRAVRLLQDLLPKRLRRRVRERLLR